MKSVGRIFAIDYAPVGETRVLAVRNGKSRVATWPGTKEDLEKALVARQKFLDGLMPEDTLLLELGGATDRLAISAAQHQGVVWRIPTFRLKHFRDAHPEKLDTVAALYQSYQDSPALFYQFDVPSAELAKLALLVRTFYGVQRTRIGYNQQIQAALRDADLLLGENPELQMVEEKQRQLAARSVAQYEEMWLKELDEATQKHPYVCRYLRTIPRVGPRIAGRCAGFIGDIRRFPNRDHLVQYCGYGVLYNRSREPIGLATVRSQLGKAKK